MPRPLLLLAVVLLAAGPALRIGQADLAFQFQNGDHIYEARVDSEHESAATATFRMLPSGLGEFQVHLRAETDDDGRTYGAMASVLAEFPLSELAPGQYSAEANRSRAMFRAQGPVIHSRREVRPTDVQLRIDRVTGDEVSGSFSMIADRQTMARVEGRFVAPLRQSL